MRTDFDCPVPSSQLPTEVVASVVGQGEGDEFEGEVNSHGPSVLISPITKRYRWLGIMIRDKYEYFVRVAVSRFTFTFSFLLFLCSVGRK